MYKFLTAILVSLMSLVAFADGHGNHGDKESEKKVEEKAEKEEEKKAEKEEEKKASNPSQIKYEDPTKYYPKK